MPDAPSRFYLDEIRNLKGAPKISSPFSHPASVKAERVATRSSQDSPPVYGAPDPDPLLAAKGCRLTVIQKLATDLGKTEYYTVHEALGTREEQDQWNRKDSYPYLLATNPRLTRTYRFFFDDLPTFVIGETTDTEVTSATLITLLEQDENAVVKDFTAIFDDIPSSDVQAGVGIDPVTGIVALGVSIAYPESPLFEVLSWAFRALKSDYVAPTTVNAACPIPGYTTLVQTNETVAPSPDEPDVVIITREYQKLPGAVVTSKDAARLPRTLTPIPGYYLNGDELDTAKQKVVAGTNPDATTDVILKSTVDETSVWYAVKTNVTRTNPTLTQVYLPQPVKAADGAEGATYRMVVSVDTQSTPEATKAALDAAVDSAIALIDTVWQVFDYDVNPLSPRQVEVVYTRINENTPLLVEQAGQDNYGVIQSSTRQIMSVQDAAAYIGNDNARIKAIDKLRSEVEINTLSTDYLDAFFEGYGTTLPRINLPDILVAVIAELDTGGEDGSSFRTGTASEIGGGTLTLNLPNSNQSSRAITIDVRPIIQSVYGESVAAMDWVIFVPLNSTTAAILAHLGTLIGHTVNPWPVFQPLAESFTCKSQKVSVRATADVDMSIHLESNGGVTSAAFAHGSSQDKDVSLSTRTTTTKAVIHGPLTISGTVFTFATAKAVADANIAGIGSAHAELELTAYASVNPYMLPATPGVHAIPSSGLYAYRVNSERYQQDRLVVRVQVIDFASIPVTLASPGTAPTLTLHTDEAHYTGGVLQPQSAFSETSFDPTVAPSITSQPQTQGVPESSPVTLTAVASGPAPITYQWSRSDHGANTYTPITGATGASYTIDSFDPDPHNDAGDYVCVVTNGNGTITSAVATLSDAPQPGSVVTITDQPQAMVLTEGGSGTLSVTATGNNLMYQWRFNGEDIDGADSSSYTIASATDDNAGSYDVVVSNATSSVTSNAAAVQVVPAPTVTVQPTDQTMGGAGAILLSATGYGVATTLDGGMTGFLTATWYRNSVAIRSTAQFSSSTIATVDGFLMATTVSTLALGQIFTGYRVAGTYYIKFVDRYGNVAASNNITVTVDGTVTENPTISVQPAPVGYIVNTRVGSSAASITFDVTATAGGGASDPVLYYWANNQDTTLADFAADYPGGTHGTAYFNRPDQHLLTLGHILYSRVLKCVTLQRYGYTLSNLVGLDAFFFDFVVAGSTGQAFPGNTTSNHTSTVPLEFVLYGYGSTGVGYPFTVTLSQMLSGGGTAHGTFSTTTLTTTNSNNHTPSLTYTPSVLDAGHDVIITGTLTFSSSTGPSGVINPSGTIGAVSLTVTVTS